MMIKQFTITCPEVYPPDMLDSKVAVIRAIRQLAGCSLKEAKDISEIPSPQTVGLVNALNDNAVMGYFELLEANGCIISSPVYSILNELRLLAARALTQGEDDLASEILLLVTAEKLRRNRLSV
jgi:hypothetical protein